MKDFTEAELTEGRPKESLETCIDRCLFQLFNDKNKVVQDDVVTGLTFEELIGTLLLTKDLIKEVNMLYKDESDYHAE